MTRRGKSFSTLLLLLLTGLLAGVGSGSAYAAGGGSIDHVEPGNTKVSVLVSVPGTAPVDLSSVRMKIGSRTVRATATNASAANLKRVAILAIDTSKSMAGTRITEAMSAANTFLATVPANVEVGVVSFDNTVKVLQPPSLDRTATKSVLTHLTLALHTSLYAGVVGAVKAATGTGARQVLILSDGKDTTGTPLSTTLDAITKAKIKVDAIALGQSGDDTAPLRQMADAGNGTLLNASDSTALTKAFAGEADALARQVLVTATIPASQKSAAADLTVSLDAGGQTYTNSAFATVRTGRAPVTSQAPLPVAPPALSISQPVLLGGIAAIGLGVGGLVICLLMGGSTRVKPTSLDDQINAYGVNAVQPLKARAESLSPIEQARAAAEQVLSNNRSLEARIASRLESAGMVVKPSEWILIHAGIAIGLGLVGLLVGGGSILFLLVFLLIGAVAPWVYLGMKRSKRLAAFDAGLADTLQLISGSLSAGLSLAQSIDTIVREGQEPITSEFKRVIVESRLGVTIEDALEGVSERMDSTDFQWVVMAIRIQREVGGNLAELLLNVAGTLREREYLRRHVKALSAEGRLSCYILGGLPPAFLVYLMLTRGSYVRPMYTSPLGWLMLGGMAVLLSVGVFWMTKVTKVDL